MASLVYEREIGRYGISVLGIAEYRWKGQGHFKHVDGGTIIYLGSQKGGLYGVVVYLDNETENTLLGYNPINERIISVRLNGKQRNITIIQVYAPTSQAEDDEIGRFYANLQSTIEATNNRDIGIKLIISGS